MVVIMIGRKRSRHASRIAALSALTPRARAANGEIDHHDAVLLDDADQQDDADHADDAEVEADTSISTSSAPTPAEGRVERMVSGWM